MFKISDVERKTLIAWAIVAVIIFIIILFIKVNPVEKKEKDKITTPGTNYINDRSRYYTVKNALTKYYSFLNAKNYDAVLKILDTNYVEENHIDINTITNYISNEDTQVSYETGIMCLKSVKNGVYTYVVKGDDIKMNSGDFIKERYYEVVLDGNTSLFSVKPIDDKYYEEVCNG